MKDKSDVDARKFRRRKNTNKKICSYINERLDLVEQAINQELKNYQRVPHCPLCHNNHKVDKVSFLVEKAFASPSAPKEKFSRVVWSGRTYYISDSFIKPIKKGSGWIYFLLVGSSLKGLERSLTKWHVTVQVNNIMSGRGDTEIYNHPGQFTALLLLPIMENPGPILKTPFWKFFLEIALFRFYLWLIAAAILILGIIQSNVFLGLLGMLLLQILVFITLIATIICKLVVFLLRKVQEDYYRKRETLAQAEDRWLRLYYCELHDGVFLDQEDSPFIYIKELQNYLFQPPKQEAEVEEQENMSS